LKASWRNALIFALLLVGTAALYFPATRFDFTTYDDGLYVADNIHVNHGFSWAAVAWGFRSFAGGNWHPLTWISHTLDCQIFGLNPHGHHGTNVLLHAVSSGMLFLLLARMTGAVWRSAMVAALFAWHPLRVESVAWIAERKDMLSTFFEVFALWA
jgi:hypothetical protein